MGIIGRLLGTEVAMKEGIGALKDGLDALVYTDEEKAQEAAKERTEGRQMLVRWMEATQGQNLARRLIALAITSVWLGTHLTAVGLNGAAVWADDATKWTGTAKLVAELANEMSGPVMLILGFYFAAPHMGKIADAALGKMKK